jgi:hypothetical protein
VEAITALLVAPPQGKPAPVAHPWLDLVIADAYGRYGKDNLQGQVMRVVTGHATGDHPLSTRNSSTGLRRPPCPSCSHGSLAEVARQCRNRRSFIRSYRVVRTF